MINRRQFVASGATGAALLGASSAGAAATRTPGDDSPSDHMARVVSGALTPEQHDMALARIAQAGWGEASLPPLASLKAEIADDFRSGASHLVKGLRLSETEIVWCVAHARKRGQA